MNQNSTLDDLRQRYRGGELEIQDATAQVMILLSANAMTPSQRSSTEAQVYQYFRGSLDAEGLAQSARERLQESADLRPSTAMRCGME